MRAIEFITEAAAPKPMDVPMPDVVDPKGVTDPKMPGQLIDKMSDISNMPTPTVKETKKVKRKKK